MLKEITATLQTVSMGWAALPLAFLLGLVSAVASACCTLPAMGLLAAYSGTRQEATRRTALVSAVSFLIGSSLALIVLGLIAGFVGQAAQAMLGRYWKLFAGILAVILGLAALKLLPVPQLIRRPGKQAEAQQGLLGAVVAGLVMGGGVAASSLPCNPGIFIVIGAAVLQGHALWGMSLMAAFAFGFSLPLSAFFLGISWGKCSVTSRKAETVIRYVAGTLLVVAGFYLLVSF